MKQDRRSFLKSALSAHMVSHLRLPALSLGTLLAQHATAQQSQKNMILIRVHGAMDNLLGLSPWVLPNTYENADLFLGYKPDEVLKNVGGSAIHLGPSAAPLAPFAKRMAIINGVFMGANDLGHPFAVQHISSGRTQESAPHWSAYLGSNRIPEKKFVFTNVSVQRGPLKPFPTMLTHVVKATLTNTNQSVVPDLSIYHDQSSALANYHSLLGNKTAFGKLREAIQTLGVTEDESILGAGIHAGLCSVAQLDINGTDGGTLDTHVAHEKTHKDSQLKRWERVARLLGYLEKLNLLNNTLVVVVTEFTRTPGLNANGGKDHNYFDNSVALFGGELGGTVHGGHSLYTRADGFSVPYLSGNLIHFGEGTTTGSGKIVPIDKKAWINNQGNVVIPKGVNLIRPENVWASIIRYLEPSLAKQLPPGVKSIPTLF